MLSELTGGQPGSSAPAACGPPPPPPLTHAALPPPPLDLSACCGSPPPLRAIRSCSASLAPATLAQLELKFKAPVLEAYAMTEASHQMTSNPLPKHGAHKPGSGGLPVPVDWRPLLPRLAPPWGHGLMLLSVADGWAWPAASRLPCDHAGRC